MRSETEGVFGRRRALAWATVLTWLFAAVIGPPQASSAVRDARCFLTPDSQLTLSAGQRQAQTFTALHTGSVASATFEVDNPSSGGDFQFQILPVDSSGAPTNPPLSLSTISNAAIGGGSHWLTGTFPSRVPLTAGGQYALAITRLGGPDYTVSEVSGNKCSGQEYFSPTQSDPFAADDPSYDLYFFIVVRQPSDFKIIRLAGRKLHLFLSSQGTVEVRDATQAGTAVTSRARKPVLKPLTVEKSGPEATIRLLLTKFGKRILRDRGVLKTRPAITFTAGGGDPHTLRPKLKIE
jgi:hypothetical protein